MKPLSFSAPRVVPDWLLRQERESTEDMPAERFWDMQRLFRSIDDLVRSHDKAGWDGYGAPPISSLAAETAKQLISSMPDNLPLPEPCPDPTGGVGLDWYVSPGMVCSVGCFSDGACNYAALMGEKDASGSFPFGKDEAFPDDLAQCIREVSRHA